VLLAVAPQSENRLPVNSSPNAYVGNALLISFDHHFDASLHRRAILAAPPAPRRDPPKEKIISPFHSGWMGMLIVPRLPSIR